MATFSEALEHAKKGKAIKPSEVKNETVIQAYKGRFYWNVQGIRIPYIPTNRHLFKTNWKLIG